MVSLNGHKNGNGRELAASKLRPYFDAKQAEKAAQAVIEELGGKATDGHEAGPVRAWLEAHPGDELRDNSGLRGFVSPRKGAAELDAQRAPDKLLRWLADHDLLRLDGGAFDELLPRFAEAALVARYVTHGPATLALYVRPVKGAAPATTDARSNGASAVGSRNGKAVAHAH